MFCYSLDVKESISHTICGLCSKSYNDPRILPCLHSFCQQCLYHEIEESDSQQVFKCPTCQRSMNIPVGGASGLPQNLHLGFEVEVAGYMSKIVGNSEVCCDECVDGRNGPAEVFCCTCYRFMCIFCHERHKRNPKWSKHNIVALDQEGAKQLQSTMKPKEYYCSQPNHEDNKLNFYCETCTLLVCRDCTTLAHKDHGVTELPTVAEVHRGEMRGTLQHVQDTLADAFDANQKKIEQVEVSKHEGELAIKQAFEQLHEALEERKKTLLSELETIALTRTTALTLQKEQLEKIQQDISHYPEVISHILQTHTDREVVAMGGVIPTELKAKYKKVETMFPHKNTGISVDFQLDGLKRELSKFGYILELSPSPALCTWTSTSVAKVGTRFVVKVESKTSKGVGYPHGGVKVQAEMRSKDHNGAVVYGEVEDHSDGTYTIILTPQTAGPHQLFITIDGQLVQNSPHDLEVMSKRDYHTLHQVRPLMYCKSNPRCVAIHGNGNIYVGCEDGCIYVFNQEGKVVNTIDDVMNTSGSMVKAKAYSSVQPVRSQPDGIYIKNDVMYIADHDSNLIRKVSLQGDSISNFKATGPAAVIRIDKYNRMIVSSSDNKLLILNHNGHVLTETAYDNNVPKCHPHGLALDPQGNIHVAAQKAINVFNQDGVFIRMYGDDLKGPVGIVIDGDGYCIVSEARAIVSPSLNLKGKRSKQLPWEISSNPMDLH